MNIINEITNRLQNVFSPISDTIRRKIFGDNNERLDFIMDSFYKLPPQHQTAVLAGAGSLLFVFVLSIFGIYFSSVQALDDELHKGFESLRNLRVIAGNYQESKSKMDWLTDKVDSKTRNFRPKAFFEKEANKIGVSLEGLRSEEAALSSDEPLGEYFSHVNVEFRMSKVSLPRLLKFLSEIERSEKNLTISELKIRARYGDRLYFDTEAKAVGFKRL